MMRHFYTRFAAWLFVTCTALALSGCAALGSGSPSAVQLGWNPALTAIRPLGKPVLGVALGSGAQRGYAHIGVMRAFERAGIRPDIITGTSAGAIVGALWAAGLRSDQIEQAAGQLGVDIFLDLSPSLSRYLNGRLTGFASGQAIVDFVERQTGKREFAQLPIRFAAVAADLHSGETIRINTGQISVAVRASAGLPILLEPLAVNFQDKRRELIDGGLVEPIPAPTARLLGADIVVAVDIGYRPYEAKVTNSIDVSFQILQIAINALRVEQLRMADLVINPVLHERDISQGNAKALIAEGERVGNAMVAQIKIRLEAARVSP